MTYYKVTNRTTRKEQIFSNDEVLQFFKCTYRDNKAHYKNDIKNYAISQTLNPKDRQINNFIDAVAISLFSVAFVILISNIIFDIIK
jgi:hypothetical protein|tara:strand:- start:143 stop:403 length:261 start_codon:yes stop_codon:yes gene_type:complete